MVYRQMPSRASTVIDFTCKWIHLSGVPREELFSAASRKNIHVNSKCLRHQLTPLTLSQSRMIINRWMKRCENGTMKRPAPFFHIKYPLDTQTPAHVNSKCTQSTSSLTPLGCPFMKLSQSTISQYQQMFAFSPTQSTFILLSHQIPTK